MVMAPTSYLGGAGAIGGVQAGYNWQLNSLVFGVEADIQAAGLRDDRTCTLTCLPLLHEWSNQYDQELGWFGTVRGRLGLASGSVLSYVTGGLAVGGVNTGINEVFFGFPAVGSFRETRTGWTAGGGLEASLGGNWTGKIEYLYIDLGSQSGSFSFTNLPHNFNYYSSDINEHIIRVGANYRFGRSGAMMPEPVADWAGLYIGGNAGSATALSPSSFTLTDLGFVGNAERFNLSPRGFIGGAQLGYNWQVANWVLGLETDIQGSTQRDDKVCQFYCVTGDTQATFDQRMEWFGTARGRLGYAVGSSLFYATGGFAYGSVKTDVIERNIFANQVYETAFAHTKTGWTVGGGIETAFDPFGLFGRHWTAKTEYLYVDLGSASDDFVTPGNAVTQELSTHVREHIFRTGLNYHFNEPVVAKY
jgi:outer membrane immunogenic protein